jgi:hypothetical protein
VPVATARRVLGKVHPLEAVELFVHREDARAGTPDVAAEIRRRSEARPIWVLNKGGLSGKGTATTDRADASAEE